MAKEPQPVESGTLLRGPDGQLYFIPDSALYAHKLGEDLAHNVRSKKVFDKRILGFAASPQAVRDLGLAASDDTPTAVAILDLSTLRRETP